MVGCTSRQPGCSVRGHSLKAVLLPAHATRRALRFFLGDGEVRRWRDYPSHFLRTVPTTPSKPVPRSSRLDGSGTVGGSLTVIDTGTVRVSGMPEGRRKVAPTVQVVVPESASVSPDPLSSKRSSSIVQLFPFASSVILLQVPRKMPPPGPSEESGDGKLPMADPPTPIFARSPPELFVKV